ncbi:MAG: methylenetetrahydrofolate reductase [Desulfobacter sp.]|nr:methylenetetrahydrofolate reductase [Desulfobacter sp.]
MSFFTSDPKNFKITLEVVPPQGSNSQAVMEKILTVADLRFDGFSVATNPVARPRMSAMAFAHLLQRQTGKPAILHFTVRDHNRLGLQAELWGAKALGLDTIIAVTGDPSLPGPEHPTTSVNDLNVFQLITMAKKSGLNTGAVLDFRPEVDGLDHEIKRMEKKAAAGCEFMVTQPVYDHDTAIKIQRGLAHINIPVIMGILPLISVKHALFLDSKVDGIAVPPSLIQKMKKNSTPIDTGIHNAREMLGLARELFSGACVMPPFDRFDILNQIL